MTRALEYKFITPKPRNLWYLTHTLTVPDNTPNENAINRRRSQKGFAGASRAGERVGLLSSKGPLAGAGIAEGLATGCFFPDIPELLTEEVCRGPHGSPTEAIWYRMRPIIAPLLMGHERSRLPSHVHGFIWLTSNRIEPNVKRASTYCSRLLHVSSAAGMQIP